jgi:nitrate/TMAO reductase-like tetraheme cytochrome c subunit
MHTMKRLGLMLALAGVALPAGLAMAGDHVYAISDPTYQAECASCHIAYPPQLLPERSWRALMSGLDKHFGTDASLDPQSAAAISAFLEQNAGRKRASKYSSSAEPVLRITETPWFVHEHDEVPARVWKSAQVKSAANCTACHVDADKGNFNEHGIRLPK